MIRVALAAGLAALASATAAQAAPPTIRGLGGPVRSVVHARAEGIVVRLRLEPRTVVFGDVVHADVDVTVDRRRIDPKDVQLATVFTPYRREGDTTFFTRDGGNMTRLHWRYTLVCVDVGCSDPGSRLRLTFPPARVYFRPRSAHGRGPFRRVLVRWSLLLIDSQLDPQAIAKSKLPLDVPPWHADVSSLPDATYRLDPTLLRALLFALAAVLAAASALLVHRGFGGTVALRRRRRRALPPLERALALVEHARAEGEAREQRKALELLAGELRRRGAENLAGDAVELAWARPGPRGEETEALASEVRRLIRNGGNGTRA